MNHNYGIQHFRYSNPRAYLWIWGSEQYKVCGICFLNVLASFSHCVHGWESWEAGFLFAFCFVYLFVFSLPVCWPAGSSWRLIPIHRNWHLVQGSFRVQKHLEKHQWKQLTYQPLLELQSPPAQRCWILPSELSSHVIHHSLTQILPLLSVFHSFSP